MALTETQICNLALARVGANAINDYSTDANVPAVWCRTFYEPDRDFLLESYWWRFAGDRATLSVSVTAPVFEYAYKFALPADFLCLRSIWDEVNPEGVLPYACRIENEFILTDESTIKIRYTKQVTDPSKFDSLFIRLLATQLAYDLVYPLAKANAVAAADRIRSELDELKVKAKMMHMAEQNLIGRAEKRTWIDSRATAGTVDPAHM